MLKSDWFADYFYRSGRRRLRKVECLRRLSELGKVCTQSAVTPKIESKIWGKFLVNPPTWPGFYSDGKMPMLIELLPQIN